MRVHTPSSFSPTSCTLLSTALCAILLLNATAQPQRPVSPQRRTARTSDPPQMLKGDDLHEENHAVRRYCAGKYGQRKFLSVKGETPPVLWTFPGSGNTWTRLVIDFATGIYTGSVYDDRSLRAALPGEIRCDRSVVMIKAHPHTHPFSIIDHSGPWGRRCASIPRFTRAVLLLRDPFDSIWSEYLRRATSSHVGSIDKASFNHEKWRQQAVQLAKEYNNMWKRSYEPFMQTYPKGFLIVKYEDLANRATRMSVLKTWLQFIGQPFSEERAKCAVVLSRHPQVRRVLKPNSMKKIEAYDASLVCKIWEIVRETAVPAGYSIWQNTTCDGVNTSMMPLS